MEEKTGEDRIKAKDSPGERVTQEIEEPVEEKHHVERKPSEKLSKSDLLKRVKEIEEEAKQHYDLYLRSQAEIENIKKRNKKEKEEWIKYSNETILKEILPVIDNLEKAVSHCQIENSFDALQEGVELTLKGLKNTLVKSGLEEIIAEGEPFDPSFHQAVSEMEDKNVKAGVILKELQKGYALNQRLIRPAMVVVSKGKPENANNYEKTPENASEK
jgi:molecular chaperone GrpE